MLDQVGPTLTTERQADIKSVKYVSGESASVGGQHETGLIYKLLTLLAPFREHMQRSQNFLLREKPQFTPVDWANGESPYPVHNLSGTVVSFALQFLALSRCHRDFICSHWHLS